MAMKKTIVLRHCKENLKKCSLLGLEKDPNFHFFTYPKSIPEQLEKTVLLTLDAPPLSAEDAFYDLFLIDGTWRYAATMEKVVLEKNPKLIKRTLPPVFTAYPRKQTECSDPERGLASIEALYLAHMITQRPFEHLLDRYYWKEAFLRNCDAYFKEHKQNQQNE